MDKQETTQDVNIRKVPTALWQRAKLMAVKRNITVRQIVTEALSQYLERNEAG